MFGFARPRVLPAPAKPEGFELVLLDVEALLEEVRVNVGAGRLLAMTVASHSGRPPITFSRVGTTAKIEYPKEFEHEQDIY